MSTEVIDVQATPGENVRDCAERAVKLAGLMSMRVRLTHNDRTVAFGPRDTVEYVVREWERKGREEQRKASIGGAWVAYYPDRSTFVPFADELSALRWALDMHASVKFVEWGDDEWMSR